MTDIATLIEYTENLESEVTSNLASVNQRLFELSTEVEELNVNFNPVTSALSEQQAILDEEMSSALAGIASQLSQIEVQIVDLENNLCEGFASVAGQLASLDSEIQAIFEGMADAESSDQAIRSQHFHVFSQIVNGYVEFALQSGDATEEVSAAEINAAGGTYTKEIALIIKDPNDKALTPFGFEPAITPAGDHVGTITWTDDANGEGMTPKFSGGVLRITIAFPDETYSAGESMTVTVDVSGNILCAGLSSVVKTYSIVA